MKILMVCLGNICRSPLAEGILQQKAEEAGLNWEVDSAGTNGFHDGEAPHVLSQKVAKANGIDISGQVSRKFTAADMQYYDRIYVMAQDVMKDVKKIAGKSFDAEKVKYFLSELNPTGKTCVPDPWYGLEDGYVEVFNLLSRTCDELISRYMITENQPLAVYE
jgi:protein-tyrosine phosphatase